MRFCLFIEFLVMTSRSVICVMLLGSLPTTVLPPGLSRELGASTFEFTTPRGHFSPCLFLVYLLEAEIEKGEDKDTPATLLHICETYPL